MNLVAFVVSDDLLHVVFATSRNTQKYRNLRANNKVAMLIDSRRNEPSDLGEALAITALGSASELAENESEHLVETYLQRHPTLRDFIHQLETAIIRVTITDYIIARFDSVERIQMGS